MPSHKQRHAPPENRIELLVQEALGEVLRAENHGLLNECRALFRKRTPLHMRAYVAAYLLIKAAGLQPKLKAGKSQVKDPGRAQRQERIPETRGKPLPKKAEGHRAAPGDTEPAVESRIKEGRFLEEGVTLFISAGRRQHIYARHLYRLISEIPAATEELISPARVLDNYSFIDVDESIADQVIAGMDGKLCRGRKLVVNRARKRSMPGEESRDRPEGTDARHDDERIDAGIRYMADDSAEDRPEQKEDERDVDNE